MRLARRHRGTLLDSMLTVTLVTTFDDLIEVLRSDFSLFGRAAIPAFSEDQRQMVRFLHYSHPVECAECGRRSRYHWTSLFSFQAMDMKGSFMVLRSASGKVHPPLTPVCGAHPMAPAEVPPLPPRKRKPRVKKP